MTLKTMLKTLKAGDTVTALSQGLELWATSPSTELGDVIVALGHHVAAGLVVTKQNWDEHARTKDPQCLTPLLATLVDEGSVKARSRLSLLTRWPADPRIDRWAVEVLAKPSFTSTSARPLFTQIAARAKEATDPFAVEQLQQAHQRRRASDPFKAIMAKVLAVLSVRKVAPVAANQATAIQELLAAIKKAPAAPAPVGTATATGSEADVLLAAWRESFDSRLVLKLDALERAAPELDLPAALKARVTTLIAASEDPSCRSRVADATVIVAKNSGLEKVRPIVQAWLAMEMDPRFGRAAVRLLNAEGAALRSWTASTKDFVTCVFTHADAAIARELTVAEQVISGPVARKKWAALLEERAASKHPLGEGAREAPTVASAPSARSEAEFLRQILASPADDSLRMVYADWLLEQGDRRGEFIQLQLARAQGKVSPAAKEREKKLLAGLRADLLGPLSACFAASGLGFERGFLVKGAPHELVDDPRLALLERLDADRLTPDDLGTTVLSGLVSATSVRPPLVAPLLALTPHLESLALTSLGYGQWKEQLQAAPRAVRHLAIDDRLYLDEPVATVNAVLASPLARQLETLKVAPLRAVFDPNQLKAVPDTLRALTLKAEAGAVSFVREAGRFIAAPPS